MYSLLSICPDRIKKNKVLKRAASHDIRGQFHPNLRLTFEHGKDERPFGKRQTNLTNSTLI